MDFDTSHCGLCEEPTECQNLVELKVEECEIVEMRHKIKVNYLCKDHYKKDFVFYSLSQKSCCDPLVVHKAKVKGDREVTLEKSKEYLRILNLEISPMKKLCSTCKKK